MIDRRLGSPVTYRRLGNSKYRQEEQDSVPADGKSFMIVIVDVEERRILLQTLKQSVSLVVFGISTSLLL